MSTNAQWHTAEALIPRIDAAIIRAFQFLVASQRPGGAFCDFFLEPGTSDGWITGFVAVAISDAEAALPHAPAREAFVRAVKWLEKVRRPLGWGYNNIVPVDADSTAFAIRALLRVGASHPDDDVRLIAFVDNNGRAHTYRDARMGTWSDPHLCVTASVGLALSEMQKRLDIRAQVANALLSDQKETGVWEGFWWAQPWYTTWQVLEFLRVEDCLAERSAEAALNGVASATGSLSVFDLAAMIGVLTEVAVAGWAVVPVLPIHKLLDLQAPDGGFPASSCLVLPDQDLGRAARSRCKGPFVDQARLLTTASSIRALSNVAAHLRSL